MRVPYVDFPLQYMEEKENLQAIVERVFSNGVFVGGGDVDELEDKLCNYTSAAHAVALNSGTDALILCLRVAGIGSGDEVITAPNSFIASVSAIVQSGATPVFADVLDDQNIDPAAIERAITNRTKAILPVHLTGRIADMNPIMELAKRHGLIVIEDAAQAFGSRYDGNMSGTIGHFGCISAHPLKNLNAAGDAGFVLTDDDKAAERLRRIRSHGLVDRDTSLEFGTVSRMDTLQAAVLAYRMGKLDDIIEKRRKNVSLYRSLLDPRFVFWPPCRDIEFNTFHTFVIQVDKRDSLKDFLQEKGVASAIHYPVPIHLQPAARDLGFGPGSFPVTEHQAGRILSLPVHQFLKDGQIRYVAETINKFYEGNITS